LRHTVVRRDNILLTDNNLDGRAPVPLSNHTRGPLWARQKEPISSN
jgi:hypothetical protein